MDTKTIDLDGRYSVAGMPGVAWYLTGYVSRETPDTWWDGITEIDDSLVKAVMVGDDRVHEIDVDDLTLIGEDDYCSSCGQIGCGHG